LSISAVEVVDDVKVVRLPPVIAVHQDWSGMLYMLWCNEQQVTASPTQLQVCCLAAHLPTGNLVQSPCLMVYECYLN
jgi:hypothetical protein